MHDTTCTAARPKSRCWQRIGLWLGLMAAPALHTQAQTAPEYRLEVGGGAGLVTYLGDFNSHLLKNQQPMVTVLAKYRFNPRTALALSISHGQLKGSSADETTYYPTVTDYSFKHALTDAGLKLEYNFWPYGTGYEYRGAKRLTPYILLGIGMTLAKADKTEAGLNMPIGAGVKYKVADRVNLAAEWAMHLTTNDRLDGIEDPYGIRRSGLFKNTDCYSHLSVTVTYDFWAKCRTCHNDRD